MTYTTLYRSEHFLVRRVGDFSKKLLVVSFDSYTDNPSLDRPGFGEGFLSSIQIDALHVISRTNAWYQYPEFDEALKTIADVSRQYEQVFTYGSSMGAYAAVRHGARLNATAIAIAPQYSVDPGIMPHENRWHEAQNLAFIQERRQPIDPPKKTFIFYDPFHKLDRSHVQKIAQDIPVTEITIPYAGHVTGVYLAEAGLLATGIRQIINNTFDPSAYIREARQRRTTTGKYYEVLSSIARHKHPEWAITFARKAAENCPGDAGHAHNLAQILKEHGSMAEAEAWEYRATELDPCNHFYQKCLGMIFLAGGKFTECQEILNKLIQASPDTADYFHLMALSFAAQMRFSEAIPFEEEAIKKDPARSLYRQDLLRFRKKLIDQKRSTSKTSDTPRPQLRRYFLVHFKRKIRRRRIKVYTLSKVLFGRLYGKKAKYFP